MVGQLVSMVTDMSEVVRQLVSMVTNMSETEGHNEMSLWLWTLITSTMEKETCKIAIITIIRCHTGFQHLTYHIFYVYC